MKKWKNIKKLTKVSIVLAIFLVSTIATASIILYFGEVETELDIKTSITIDNRSYNNPIKHKLELYTGDSINVTHVICNRAKMCNVMINQTTSGLVNGVTLTFYDKDDLPIIFPFRLNASSSMVITMTFHADINFQPQKVKITTRFSVSEL